MNVIFVTAERLGAPLDQMTVLPDAVAVRKLWSTEFIAAERSEAIGARVSALLYS